MLKPFAREDEDPEILDPETIQEIQQALQTINKRSIGLLHFVNTYRNLTRIPKPNFRIVKVIDVFNNLELLMENDLTNADIKFHKIADPPGMEISMDEQLIEQVLINLMKNSFHALENRKDGVITLRAFLKILAGNSIVYFCIHSLEPP
jgi:nitrogen fixation/metabolism regulation signal transduction histidine kinase